VITVAKYWKIADRNRELRSKLWPSLTEEMIWDKRQGGFRILPRTVPLFFKIMDELSSGFPLSKTYFALWCRSFEEMFLQIKSEKEMAFESGFAGQRAIYEWRRRMKLLTDVGFILSAPGPNGDFSYVQIIDPYYVTETLRKNGKVSDRNYNALLQRFSEIKVEPLDNGTEEGEAK
jgi:hypothetical protein